MFVQKENHSIATEVNNLYSDPNVRQLLVRELSSLQQRVHKIEFKYNKVLIYIHIDIRSQDYHGHKEAEYLITIGKSFPIGSVRLYMINGYVQPKLNDFRDLLPELLAEGWSYKHTIKQIIELLTDFTKKVQSLNTKMQQLQRFGTYHIGEYVPVGLLTEMHQIEQFPVIELTQKEKQQRLLGISEANMLIFRRQRNPNIKKYTTPINKSETPLILETAFNTQIINEVLYDKNDEIIILKLRVHKNEPVEQETDQFQNIERKFFCKGCSHFILRKLLKTIDKYQSMKINYFPNKKIDQATLSKIKAITLVEKEVKEHNTVEALQKLNKLYQNIIEFYSQRGECMYLVYVHKLNELYKKMPNKQQQQ